MTPDRTPDVDRRDLAALVAEVEARAPGYVPEWAPGPGGGAGIALVHVLARQLRALTERLNLAPDKAKVAFLDRLGIGALAPQAARVPLVFEPMPHLPDGSVPAGTRAGAKVPGLDEPLVFETERAVALAAAHVAEIVSVWPARDACSDHMAAIRASQPFTLFEPSTPVPHELYLAHDTHFNLSGRCRVELRFELATPGDAPLDIEWGYWDGKGWRGFTAFRAHDDPQASFDGTAGLTRSGVVRLVTDCAEAASTTVNGITAFWLRGRLVTPLPPGAGPGVASIDRIGVRTLITAAGLAPDAADADGRPVDLTKSFLPFGQQARAGAVFHVANANAFSKPGALLTLAASAVTLPQGDPAGTEPDPEVVAESWDGRRWVGLAAEGSAVLAFAKSGSALTLRLPAALRPTTVNGQESYWLRLRIRNGGFVRTRTITFEGGDSVVIVEQIPPALAELSIGYDYASPEEPPQACLAYDDFRWADRTEEAVWQGSSFPAFVATEDRTPTLYLGFDRALPVDLVSLYLDIDEEAGSTEGPPLRWEYHDGAEWRPLGVEDGTRDLALPGTVAALWPGVAPTPSADVLHASGTQVTVVEPRDAAGFVSGDLVYVSRNEAGELATVAGVELDTVTLARPLSRDYSQATIAVASLPRFGTPRTWLRARLEADGEPRRTRLRGVHLNAAWAAQVETNENELLGSGTGEPSQVLFFRRSPVVAGQVVEVRELEGARAAIELPMLLDELAGEGLAPDDARRVVDRRTGEVSEVWVRWQERPHLFFSQPGDRHYVIERGRGWVRFGDGRRGRVLPVGADNVRARVYRSGGGRAGNVPLGAVTQVLSGVLAKRVQNARAGEGGADGEPTADVLVSGPETVRTGYQAVSLRDYEALARRASPAVAVARAVPTTHPSGRPAAGWVKVVVVPRSEEPRPQPSFGLRRQVTSFLAARVPATVADRISVVGPDYVGIGVRAVVAPVDASAGGRTRAAVEAALLRFLHPLTGGPEGAGWAFGRDVHVSDVAVLVEGVAGVDYVTTLELLLDGNPVGASVPVPADRIVVAGVLQISLTVREG